MNLLLNQFFRVFFVSLLILPEHYFTKAQCVGECESCRTPRGQDGQCISIRNCPELYQILLHRPIRAEDADFLRISNCGFEGLDPKVCCAFTNNNNNQVSSSTLTPITKSPSTTDGNANFNLADYQSNLLPKRDVCGLGLDNKIIGGEATQLDEFPWMVLIEYQKPRGKGFYCGGVLINDRYILTAAHCVVGKDIPKSWTVSSVRLGEYNTDTEEDCVDSGNNNRWCSDKPIDVPVAERIPHEDYVPTDTNQYNDIALLRLSKKVTFTNYINPICLSDRENLIKSTYEGDEMYVAGWGKTESKSESSIKLKLKVPVKKYADCFKRYKEVNLNLSKKQLCAGGESGKDSCRGDSGGPLMGVDNGPNKNGTNWYAVGIVSFGPSPCGLEGWPGVYTKVNDFIPWIISKIRS